MAVVANEQRLSELAAELEKVSDYVDAEEFDQLMSEMSDSSSAAAVQKSPELFRNCVIVDNLPQVDEAKHGKLSNVVKKIFGQVGVVQLFNMPIKEKKTTGIAFLAFEQIAEAENAVKTLDNFALDKRHTLSVNLYADLFMEVPETYQPLPVATKDEKEEKEDLKNWLMDPTHRDMFCLRHGSETEVYWSDNHGNDATLDYGGDREKQNGKQWCNQYVTWSPQGTYLCTFHPQGIALWGGEKWAKLGRFAHKHVKIAVFSPLEKYMITCNETEGENAIIVWEVATGKLLRSFPSSLNKDPTLGLRTPFKWSHDGKYVARRGENAISIYELPSMKLLEKKSLKAEGIHNFVWSPTDNIIAYWAPEINNNVPARVSLVDIPSRKDIRQKNLVNVSDCKLHWQADGNYLCVKVTRHSKSKKTLYTNFELFRLRENLVPVEMLEMKENVVAFAWEPKGSRFAVVHGETALRLSVSFYEMNGGKNNKELELKYSLKDKSCNHLYWSPQGNNIILAGLGDMNGSLEFWDATEQQSLAQQEHFKCTHVSWDPSGRIVSSSVCQAIDNAYYKYQMDNGYKLWSFQGKLLVEQKKDSFYQFLWRPRPKSLLSATQYKNVVKNLKKFEKKYNDLDKKKKKERVAAEKAERQRIVTEFEALLADRKKIYEARRQAIIDLRDGYDSEDEDNYIIQKSTIDEIISQKEEICN